MSDFKLDTSGVVAGPGWLLRWSDLSPFEQGYVEAMLRDVRYQKAGAGVNKGDHVVKWDERVNCANSRLLAFRDLARETLARIRKDCASVQRTYPSSYPSAALNEDGAIFWKDQDLAPYLGDDGLIYFREASVSSSMGRG